MMPNCVYRNCHNTYDKHRTLFTFHSFPPKSEELLRKKWLLNCGLDEDFDCSRSRICSAHFKPEDFERDLKAEFLNSPSKKRLKDIAEPFVNLSVVKEERVDVCDENSLIYEFRPNYILEQLAEVAVSRALNNGNYDSVSARNFNEVTPGLNNTDYDNVPSENCREEVVPVESIQSNDASQPIVSVTHVPSSLPSSQNWPGEYDFNVSFSPQEKNTKGVSWTYSKAMDKLYVGKDAPCPINFSTSSLMSDKVKIRAMALYSNPESASEIVKRCVNHSQEERASNIFEAEHLVRCESCSAIYENDPSTERHSVLVPFENPEAGQQYSTYIYKFTCFGSCPFGPNRRPLMLVFTLERENQVIGRRKVDVKICACPGRDRKTDEQQLIAFQSGSSKKRKEPEGGATLFDVLSFTKNVNLPSLPKTPKLAPNVEGKYELHVDDPELFNFLVQMKKFYEFCKIIQR